MANVHRQEKSEARTRERASRERGSQADTGRKRMKKRKAGKDREEGERDGEKKAPEKVKQLLYSSPSRSDSWRPEASKRASAF